MSQYPPSPYSPPVPQPYGYGYSVPDPAGPARRAGLLLYVLGGLLAVLGACNTISSLVMDPEQVLAEQTSMLPAGQAPPFSAQTLQKVSAVVAVVILLIGVLLISLGTPVRRGSRGATLAALFVTGGILLLVLGFALLTVLAAIVAPIMLAMTCVSVIPLALFALETMWLVQALRGGQAQVMQQYQQQYWQYTQQQAWQQAMAAYQQQWQLGQQSQPPSPSPAPHPQAPPPGAPADDHHNDVTPPTYPS